MKKNNTKLYKTNSISVYNRKGIKIKIKAKHLLDLEMILKKLLRETKNQLEQTYSTDTLKTVREVYKEMYQKE